jgi:hypothetical protein
MLALCFAVLAACGGMAPATGGNSAPATQQLLQQFEADTSRPSPASPTATKIANYTCDNCIKGNISDGRKIYHFPGCPNYNAAKIDEKRGERWFSSEEESRAAGWRKAENCP